MHPQHLEKYWSISKTIRQLKIELSPQKREFQSQALICWMKLIRLQLLAFIEIPNCEVCDLQIENQVLSFNAQTGKTFWDRVVFCHDLSNDYGS